MIYKIFFPVFVEKVNVCSIYINHHEIFPQNFKTSDQVGETVKKLGVEVALASKVENLTNSHDDCPGHGGQVG